MKQQSKEEELLAQAMYLIVESEADLDRYEHAKADNARNGGSKKQLLTDNSPLELEIHSPRVPSTEEIVNQVNKMLTYIPKEKLWIDPDCGLKTQGWPEVEQVLHNMQSATTQLRQHYLS